jgi:hypothetical protein
MSRSAPRKAGAPVKADASAASTLTPFELSRVYAKGWLADMNCEAPSSPEVVMETAGSLNPYSNDVERARWQEGFTQAVKRKYGIDVAAPAAS